LRIPKPVQFFPGRLPCFFHTRCLIRPCAPYVFECLISLRESSKRICSARLYILRPVPFCCQFTCAFFSHLMAVVMPTDPACLLTMNRGLHSSFLSIFFPEPFSLSTRDFTKKPPLSQAICQRTPFLSRSLATRANYGKPTRFRNSPLYFSSLFSVAFFLED